MLEPRIGFPCLDLFFVLSTPLLFSLLLLLCQDLGECERQEKGVMHGCPLQLLLYSPLSFPLLPPVALLWCSWVPMKCGEKSIGDERRCEVTWLAFFFKWFFMSSIENPFNVSQTIIVCHAEHVKLY